MYSNYFFNKKKNCYKVYVVNVYIDTRHWNIVGDQEFLIEKPILKPIAYKPNLKQTKFADSDVQGC